MPKIDTSVISLRDRLPSDYIKKVQRDLKKRKKKVYDAGYISSVALEKPGIYNDEIFKSILNVAEAHAKQRRKMDIQVKGLRKMKIVKVKFNLIDGKS